MNPSLLALGASACYGLADFAGGFTSKARSAWAVVGWAQAIGVIVLAAGLIIVPAPGVRGQDLALGAVAGLAGVLGLNLLYRALASGVMAVVAPISAASGAVVSVGVGLLRGEVLGWWKVLGLGLAIGAVISVTWQPGEAHMDRRPVWMATAAGVFFGMFFVAMSFTSQSAGLWPLVPARAVSIALALSLAGGDRWPPVKDYMAWVVMTGLLDMLANVFMVLAAQRGPLSVVAVLGSLYPVFTVAAAVVYLKERPAPIQVAGVLMGIGAVVVLA